MKGIVIAPKKTVSHIPCYGDSEYQLWEGNREKAQGLSSLAATIGWKTALGALDPPLRKQITYPNRSLFLAILSIREGDRILDLGTGWGIISAQMAKGFPTTNVYAADNTVERLCFAQQIKYQEHLKNMHVLQCNIMDPPFEKEFFDVVIMIDTLERLGLSDTSSPRIAQERGLRAIHDIIRPGGTLLIGTNNRLASLYMGTKENTHKTTYASDQHGYRKMLEQAGFDSLKFYAALPNYQYTNRICNIDRVKDTLRHRAVKLLPGKVVGALVPSFYIVAER